MSLTARTATCPDRHAFDLAKQGYLNLLPTGSTGIHGDSAAMIEARADFLGRGHYAPIRDALVSHTPGDGLVVEIGAGTAYYLAGVIDASPGRTGLALDVSRYAARRAAKVAPRIGSVVCDAWQELPVQDNAAQVVLNVFAPRNAAEMARVLAPGGSLLVVTPNQGHLSELIDVLGMVRVDEHKERRLDETLAGHFRRSGDEVVEATLRLDHSSVERLVAMTPSARHTEAEAVVERIRSLAEPVGVTLSVTVSGWQPITG